ncbi:hypothetical protein PMAYCL1PPCAC_30326, partial [Pristionchus mayeri]
RRLDMENGVNYIRGFLVGADFMETTSPNASTAIIEISLVILAILTISALIIIICIVKLVKEIGQKRDGATLRQSLKRLICQALNPLIFLYL